MASLTRATHPGPLPPTLQGLMRCLDAWRIPIPAQTLLREVGAVHLALDDVRSAVASDPLAYVRTLIHSGPCYEALIMCWLPNQRSPIHDHGGSACAVRIVSGAAVEMIYALDPSGLASPVSQSLFTSGDVVCSADADVHSLANALTGNAPGELLVTLHIYSPPLRSTRKYAQLPAVPLARTTP